jgi:kynurenine formamidase
MTADRGVPSRDQVLQWLDQRRNWGRWGPDDQRGAINLITPAKRVAAAALVRSGRAVSLSREFPKTPSPINPNPAQHFMQWRTTEDGGVATDYYGISYHGYATTHIDALCHMWGWDGMWGGRDHAEGVGPQGARWGAIDQWYEGITTRGVLFDLPRFRGEPSVTPDRPVHGWELEEIARQNGVTLEPGDAIAVYCGREAYVAADPSGASRPGLHASCLGFIRDHDVAVLVWDMLDAVPNDYQLYRTVHYAIWAFGVALVDNALLEPLARACAEEGRATFMLTIAPLRVAGGTGSPVNPIALF